MIFRTVKYSVNRKNLPAKCDGGSLWSISESNRDNHDYEEQVTELILRFKLLDCWKDELGGISKFNHSPRTHQL